MKACNTDFTFSIFTSSQTKLHVKFKFVCFTKLEFVYSINLKFLSHQLSA